MTQCSRKANHMFPFHLFGGSRSQLWVVVCRRQPFFWVWGLEC